MTDVSELISIVGSGQVIAKIKQFSNQDLSNTSWDGALEVPHIATWTKVVESLVWLIESLAKLAKAFAKLAVSNVGALNLRLRRPPRG